MKMNAIMCSYTYEYVCMLYLWPIVALAYVFMGIV